MCGVGCVLKSVLSSIFDRFKSVAKGSAPPVSVTVTVPGRESRGPSEADLQIETIRLALDAHYVHAMFVHQEATVVGAYPVNSKTKELASEPEWWYVSRESDPKEVVRDKKKIKVAVTMSDEGAFLNTLVGARYRHHRQKRQESAGRSL